MNLDGTLYTGPKVAYDIHSWTGVTFWAMATAGSDVNLRVNLPMLATLRLADGGNCDEADAGVGKCGDHWGAPVTLPANGKWMQISMRISDAAFRQQGSGTRSLGSDPGDRRPIPSPISGRRSIFWIDETFTCCARARPRPGHTAESEVDDNRPSPSKVASVSSPGLPCGALPRGRRKVNTVPSAEDVTPMLP